MPCKRTPVKEIWVTCESGRSTATTTVTTSTAAGGTAPATTAGSSGDQRSRSGVTARQAGRGTPGAARGGKRGVSADAAQDLLTRSRALREGFIYEKDTRSFHPPRPPTTTAAVTSPERSILDSPIPSILTRVEPAVTSQSPLPVSTSGEVLAVPLPTEPIPLAEANRLTQAPNTTMTLTSPISTPREQDRNLDPPGHTGHPSRRSRALQRAEVEPRSPFEESLAHGHSLGNEIADFIDRLGNGLTGEETVELQLEYRRQRSLLDDCVNYVMLPGVRAEAGGQAGIADKLRNKYFALRTQLELSEEMLRTLTKQQGEHEAREAMKEAARPPTGTGEPSGQFRTPQRPSGATVPLANSSMELVHIEGDPPRGFQAPARNVLGSSPC